jgi:xylono-1,5-lactonase
MEFVVVADGFQFAEAPRVDEEGTVYFSDLTGGGYYRRKLDGAVETVLPDRLWIGGAVLDVDGSIICSGKGGLIRIDRTGGAATPILTELDGIPIIAINDIEADGSGGVFGGSVDFAAVFERNEVPGGGQLFYLSRDGTVRILRDGLAVSNGLGFSPDGRMLYHSESTTGIWAYCLGKDGMPGRPHMFAHIDDCDGLAVDSEGGVWVACWRSAQILRYRADGVLDQTLTLPFPHIVSLCFGGPDLTDLYVATGGNAEQPRKGGVVRIKTEVPGLRPCKSRLV